MYITSICFKSIYLLLYQLISGSDVDMMFVLLVLRLFKAGELFELGMQ